MILIWSNEHVAWWRPGKGGYTMDIREAGVYSKDNAREIIEEATRGRADWDRQIPFDLPVRITDLPLAVRRLVGKAYGLEIEE